jgi:hypothetical protein
MAVVLAGAGIAGSNMAVVLGGIGVAAAGGPVVHLGASVKEARRLNARAQRTIMGTSPIAGGRRCGRREKPTPSW